MIKKIIFLKGALLIITVMFLTLPGKILALEATLIDLGTLGGTWSIAYGVNDLGQVVGLSFNALNETHPFIIIPEDNIGDDGVPDTWFRDNNNDGINDLMIDLGSYEGSTVNYGEAFSVNNNGKVVGWSGNHSRGFIVSPEDNIGDDNILDTWFRDTNSNGKNDIMEPLDILSGTFINYYDYEFTPNSSLAIDVNNNDQVVGWSFLDTGEGHPRWDFNTRRSRAVLWEEGEIIDLGIFGYAVAINDLRQIIGHSWGEESRAFLWQNDEFIYIDGLDGSDDNRLKTINNAGLIFGISFFDSSYSNPYRIFMWENGITTDLGPTFYDRYYDNLKLNDLGQLIASTGYFSYYWSEDEGWIDLGDLLNTSVGLNVEDINNAGQIACSVGSSYSAHACIINITLPPTPVEEVEQIIDDVNDVVTSGGIDEREGTLIVAKLEIVEKIINEGNENAACKVLQALINQINSQIRSRKLTFEEGQGLIDSISNANFCQ
jgi:probable HAF family extracellular repeat protein